MAENHFDKANRYTARRDPEGVFAWLLGLVPEAFAFRNWLDTRAVPFPGEPDRTNDTVGYLEDLLRYQIPWAVALEFQVEPDPEMFGRLLGYLGNIWRQCRPDSERGSRFHVGAVVVNLTGKGNASRRLDWPEAGLQTELMVVERNLAEEDADLTLARIEQGELSRGILPWIPVMRHGEDTGIIDRWKVVAEAEPDAARRGDYGGLARFLSDAADRLDIWTRALEGWNMTESQVAQEWIAQGEVKGAAGMLLCAIQTKFGSLPTDVEQRIRSTVDVSLLQEWMVHVTTADSLEDFRQSVQG